MGFANNAALWSFIGIMLCIVALVTGFVFLWYCYFPGGYLRQDVMDLGDYAIFVAQMKHEERAKKLEKSEEEDHVNQYDDLYYEMDPEKQGRDDHDSDDDGDDDDLASRRDASDWRSVGTAEQRDIEGREFYDDRSASSPSSYSPPSAHTFDNQSMLSPTSLATPSTRGSLKPALKAGRDDRSESTFTSRSDFYG